MSLSKKLVIKSSLMTKNDFNFTLIQKILLKGLNQTLKKMFECNFTRQTEFDIFVNIEKLREKV